MKFLHGWKKDIEGDDTAACHWADETVLFAAQGNRSIQCRPDEQEKILALKPGESYSIEENKRAGSEYVVVRIS